MTKLLVALGFLALNLYTYHYLATDVVIPPRATFSDFPLEFEDGWACAQRETMDPKIVQNLGVTDYLICEYRRGKGEVVGVYVGYHQSQVREEGGGPGDTSIHPPAHCLPGSGWDIIDNRTVKLDLPGLPEPDATGKRLIIAKGTARDLVYYWYQSRGRVIAEDWKKIIYVGWDRATRRRTDGSLVRFTVSIFRNDEEAAEANFRSLAPQILGRLPEFVPE